jgi:hypothetical protein
MDLTTIGSGLKWAWDNKTEIRENLSELRAWFRGTGKDSPGILILGPGGSGKTTLAKLLSGETDDWFLDPPRDYVESIGIERTALKDAPNVSVVVPPGQTFRRDATWSDLLHDVSQGKYRGIIVVSAYGYGSFSKPSSYKDHQLYEGNKAEFWARFTERERQDEIEVVRRVAGAIAVVKGKVWLLSVVLKQDLWWHDHTIVEEHYRQCDYQRAIQEVSLKMSRATFRHELHTMSLVISNLKTASGETLQENAKGYDQHLQAESQRRLFEIVHGLRRWEDEK